MNSRLLSRFLPLRGCGSHALCRSKSDKTTTTAESIIASAVDAEKQLVQDMFEAEESASRIRTEDELLALRDKSRLRPYHRVKVNAETMDTSPPEPKTWWHNSVKYKRKMYAKYGEASGINPGLQWPTTQELAKRKEYESVAYPFTLEEMMESVRQKKQLEQDYIDQRTKQLDENMAKLDKQIQEVLDKREAKERDLRKAQEKRERLVEEVRRHFGYTVDPRDDRFKELLEKKEKEERKKLKEARKLEKQERFLKKLAEMGSKSDTGTKGPVPSSSSEAGGEEEKESSNTKSANKSKKA